jgi:Asp/Glu/hydantoin racemase
MPKTLALIHTVSGVLPLFNGLCDELLPDVKRFHIADEALLRAVLAAGGMTPAIYRRLNEHVLFAVDAGADVILVTCSSVSPGVDVAQKMVAVPVLKVDEAMADKAVELGPRVAVLATAPTTLKPTSELIAARGALAGKPVSLQPVLCVGAYDELLAGNLARHDQIVAEYLRRAMEAADVVVLAQASMARVADALPAAEKRVPILTSPRLGIERTREVINRL